jgi:hypothetical protein
MSSVLRELFITRIVVGCIALGLLSVLIFSLVRVSQRLDTKRETVPHRTTSQRGYSLGM